MSNEGSKIMHNEPHFVLPIILGLKIALL